MCKFFIWDWNTWYYNCVQKKKKNKKEIKKKQPQKSKFHVHWT